MEARWEKGASARYGNELEVQGDCLTFIPGWQNRQRPNCPFVNVLISISPPLQNDQKWKWPKKREEERLVGKNTDLCSPFPPSLEGHEGRADFGIS